MVACPSVCAVYTVVLGGRGLACAALCCQQWQFTLLCIVLVNGSDTVCVLQELLMLVVQLLLYSNC